MFYWVISSRTLMHNWMNCVILFLDPLFGVAMDTEPYPVVAGLLIRKAVTW